MKYLCLIFDDRRTIEALPPADKRALERRMVEHAGRLRANGESLLSAALQPGATAVTVRRRDGRLTVTDGPYAETNEQLGGFFLLDAFDLSDAVRLASHLPVAGLATLEVRPAAQDPGS